MTFFGVEIGRPQFIGGFLLLALAAEAALTSYETPLSLEEIRSLNRSVEITAPIKPELKDPVTDSILLYRITRLFEPSLEQFQQGGQLQPPRGGRLQESQQLGPNRLLRFLPTLYRLPFLIFGLWLGGALWWVSRRLFNNEGGYVALALFCFSPLVVRYASTINAEIIAAWGLFGIVYTAIGVGHTLYSPPRRWPPRIVLLGLAFGFTAAAHVGAAALGAALAIFFLLYLSPPDRKWAATAVLVMAFLVACIFVWGCYGWNASLINFSSVGQALQLIKPKDEMLAPWFQPRNWPTMALLLPALGIFVGWKRTRYFGNWTPLLVIALLGVLQFSGTMPAIWVAPFVCVFVGGIAADLLESQYRRWTRILFVALIGAQAVSAFPLHW